MIKHISTNQEIDKKDQEKFDLSMLTMDDFKLALKNYKPIGLYEHKAA